MFRIEHNVETGEITQIDLTPEEEAASEASQSVVKEATDKANAEITVKKAARAALITKLGLTEDEAKLLLGGN